MYDYYEYIKDRDRRAKKSRYGIAGTTEAEKLFGKEVEAIVDRLTGKIIPKIKSITVVRARERSMRIYEEKKVKIPMAEIYDMMYQVKLISNRITIDMRRLEAARYPNGIIGDSLEKIIRNTLEGATREFAEYLWTKSSPTQVEAESVSKLRGSVIWAEDMYVIIPPSAMSEDYVPLTKYMVVPDCKPVAYMEGMAWMTSLKCPSPTETERYRVVVDMDIHKYGVDITAELAVMYDVPYPYFVYRVKENT